MVTLKADNKRRVAIPHIKPGQVFAYEIDPTGTIITLHRVKKVDVKEQSNKGRLEKRGKRLLGVTERPITSKMVKELLADFP